MSKKDQSRMTGEVRGDTRQEGTIGGKEGHLRKRAQWCQIHRNVSKKAKTGDSWTI